MKRVFKFIWIIFFIINGVFAAEKLPSQSGPTENKRGFHIALGLGVVIKNNMRKDNTYKYTHGDLLFSPIPLVQLGWGPLSFGGQGLKADLYGNRQWGVYTNIDRLRERYHGADMDDRHDSWFWGIGGRFGKFSAHFSRDIQGRSKGRKWNFTYAEMYKIQQKFFTRSSVGLECFNKKYADYYYGVRFSEVTSYRPEYHPSGFCQPTISFAPMYKMDDHISFISALALKGLAKEIRNSPTTKGGNLEAGLIFGSLWQF